MHLQPIQASHVAELDDGSHMHYCCVAKFLRSYSVTQWRIHLDESLGRYIEISRLTING